MLHRKQFRSILILALIFLFITTGCSHQSSKTSAENPNAKPAAATVAPTIPITATHQPSPTPISPTVQPTLTATPTATSKPVDTSTPTLAPTSTPAKQAYLPGLYSVNKCTIINNIADFCIVSVEVTKDRNMVFLVYWKARKYQAAIKRSSFGMKTLYIVDNLGNKYLPIKIGGDSTPFIILISGADYDLVRNGRVYHFRSISYGTFTFAPAKPGATSFLFHGTGANGIIYDIVLDPDKRTTVYETLHLKDSPLMVDYRIKSWEINESENSNPLLQHKEYKFCTIQQATYSDPKGKYKNTVTFNQIDYKIYGWWEKDWSVREYVPVSGLDEISDSHSPIFLVTIPYGKDERICLNKAGEVLATLYTNP